MHYPKEKFGTTTSYVFLIPIIVILFTYNLIRSSFKKEIEWYGKYYRKKDALKKMKL